MQEALLATVTDPDGARAGSTSVSTEHWEQRPYPSCLRWCPGGYKVPESAWGDAAGAVVARIQALEGQLQQARCIQARLSHKRAVATLLRRRPTLHAWHAQPRRAGSLVGVPA